MKRTGRNARIDGIRSTSLADAMGRAFSHRSQISGLLSPTPERVLFGPAVTVQYVDTCEIHTLRRIQAPRRLVSGGPGEPDIVLEEDWITLLAANQNDVASTIRGTLFSNPGPTGRGRVR